MICEFGNSTTDHDDRSEDESDRASVGGEERQVGIVMERIILQHVTGGGGRAHRVDKEWLSTYDVGLSGVLFRAKYTPL